MLLQCHDDGLCALDAGGVIAVTSRILAVDLLTERVPADKVRVCQCNSLFVSLECFFRAFSLSTRPSSFELPSILPFCLSSFCLPIRRPTSTLSLASCTHSFRAQCFQKRTMFSRFRSPYSTNPPQLLRPYGQVTGMVVWDAHRVTETSSEVCRLSHAPSH